MLLYGGKIALVRACEQNVAAAANIRFVHLFDEIGSVFPQQGRRGPQRRGLDGDEAALKLGSHGPVKEPNPRGLEFKGLCHYTIPDAQYLAMGRLTGDGGKK
jgi:hypothetical protein